MMIAIAILFLASVAAQIFLLVWLRNTDKRKAQLLDQQVVEQTNETIQQVNAALDALPKEREAILVELESSISSVRADLDTIGGDEASRQVKRGLDGLSKVLLPSCGNAALDSVLSLKAAQALEQGCVLETTAAIDGELPMSDVELTSLAFNLIDNAIEGAKGAERVDGRRNTVAFNAFVKAGQFIMTVENPCDPALKGAIKPRASYKDEAGRTHGLGMRIVENVTEQHRGTTSFRAKDGLFKASVMIPLK